jgi:hypothetical protein
VVVVCCNGGGSQWFSSTMFCDFEVLKSDFFFLKQCFYTKWGQIDNSKYLKHTCYAYLMKILLGYYYLLFIFIFLRGWVRIKCTIKF